jgi:uncharacterized protein
VLTLVTLPGTWLIVLWALGICIWQPSIMPWWMVLVLVVLAAIGEGLEFLASAIGAAKAGASRWGIVLAVIGALLGAIVGMFVIPIIGAIIGGALGAACGAIAGESWVAKRPWNETKKVATGAAIGRLLATLAKGVVAAVMGAAATLMVVLQAE